MDCFSFFLSFFLLCFLLERKFGRTFQVENIGEKKKKEREKKVHVERSRTVHWVHVKGHSRDGGNDRANELVQWGKEEGPYARLRALGVGEGDRRFGAAIRENSSLGSEKRVDNLGNGALHRGHK